MKHKLLYAIMGYILLHGTFNASAQTVKPYDLIGQMILQNQSSVVNPIYTIPRGTVNTACFLSTAIAAGDAVQKPLSYFASSAPTGYYINYSLTSTICERGKTFQLNLLTNKYSGSVSSAWAYAFADWNRDGVFETALGQKEITGLNSKETPGVGYTIAIPDTASIGKTRIRVYLTTANIANLNANDVLTSGYIHDFVMFTVANSGVANSSLVAVSTNNNNWGSAVVKTDSPTGDGKYPVGSNVTLEAIVTGNNSSFVGWSDGTNIVSTAKNYNFMVSSPVYLIAIFKSVMPTLSAPQSSTAEAPIWYQIKNAQTDSRLNCFICYDGALKIQKPEDTSDKFLWRLESAVNNMVKLINKGSNKQMYSTTGALNEVVTVADAGSNFLIQPSGNTNGSYSILYNGGSTSLLNGNMSFALVIYNSGVGTGSGWYFYKVPAELLNTGISEEFAPKYKIYPCNDKLSIEGLEAGTQLTIYSMLGHSVMKCNIEAEKQLIPFALKGAFVAVARSKNGQVSTFKFIR